MQALEGFDATRWCRSATTKENRRVRSPAPAICASEPLMSLAASIAEHYHCGTLPNIQRDQRPLSRLALLTAVDIRRSGALTQSCRQQALLIVKDRALRSREHVNTAEGH